MKFKLTVFILALFASITFFQSGAHAGLDDELAPPPEVEPMELDDTYYFRVSIPEDQKDNVTVTYVEGGEVTDLEVADLLSTRLFLSMTEGFAPFDAKDVPFYAVVNGDDVIFHLKKPGGIALYSADLTVVEGEEEKEISVSKESDLTITVPGGALHLIKMGQIDQFAGEGPMEITDAKGFIQLGEVEIRFLETAADDNAGDDQNNDGDDLDQVLPEGDSAGGCSMALAGSSANPALAYLLLGIAFLGIRRVTKK